MDDDERGNASEDVEMTETEGEREKSEVWDEVDGVKEEAGSKDDIYAILAYYFISRLTFSVQQRGHRRRNCGNIMRSGPPKSDTKLMRCNL